MSNRKVLVFCPEWEVLRDKCELLVNRLRDLNIDVEIFSELKLEHCRYVIIRDQIIKLPQVVLLENGRIVKILDRDFLDSHNISDIISMLIS